MKYRLDYKPPLTLHIFLLIDSCTYTNRLSAHLLLRDPLPTAKLFFKLTQGKRRERESERELFKQGYPDYLPRPFIPDVCSCSHVLLVTPVQIVFASSRAFLRFFKTAGSTCRWTACHFSTREHHYAWTCVVKVG